MPAQDTNSFGQKHACFFEWDNSISMMTIIVTKIRDEQIEIIETVFHRLYYNASCNSDTQMQLPINMKS